MKPQVHTFPGTSNMNPVEAQSNALTKLTEFLEETDFAYLDNPLLTHTEASNGDRMTFYAFYTVLVYFE